MRIAIVGSEAVHWTRPQRERVVQEIADILKLHDVDEPPVLVSGGCPKGGVDIWAEIVADILGYKKKIFDPDVAQWDDDVDKESGRIFKGYKSRNIDIAEFCDVIYCFDPAWRTWSGGRFTAREAEKLGKDVHIVGVS